MIPHTVRPMPEALRTLVLEGVKHAGSCQAAHVLIHIEEHLTTAQLCEVEKFCKWLEFHELTIGHGTISLRWDEFKSKRTPASQEEAYQWAIKKAGV